MVDLNSDKFALVWFGVFFKKHHFFQIKQEEKWNSSCRVGVESTVGSDAKLQKGAEKGVLCLLFLRFR